MKCLLGVFASPSVTTEAETSYFRDTFSSRRSGFHHPRRDLRRKELELDNRDGPDGFIIILFLPRGLKINQAVYQATKTAGVLLSSEIPVGNGSEV